jgi:hypothetical protein
MWIIKDREREISTGCGKSERAKAEIALAEYITQTRQPSFGNGDSAQVLIGDCLSVYCEKHGPTIARPDGLALEVERLAEYWGDKFVAERNLQRVCRVAVRANRQACDQERRPNDQAVDRQARTGHALGRAELVLAE